MISLKWLFVGVFALATVAAGYSFLSPTYDWDLQLPSPDGQYDLVVLRGDAAAFDDFSYRVYLFPQGLVPNDRAKGARVWMTPIWRGSRYFVYSGYSLPMLRWTGSRSIEIDLNEAYYEPFSVEQVKRFDRDTVLVSVMLDKEDGANAMP